MAGTTSIFKVHYHFESGGKKASQDYVDYVSAAANDYESIRTVLNNNSRILTHSGGKLVISSVQSVGPGLILI